MKLISLGTTFINNNKKNNFAKKNLMTTIEI